MPDKRLSYLFYCYLHKTASAEERAELMALLQDPENDEQVLALMEESWQGSDGGETVFSSDQSEALLRHLLQTGAADTPGPGTGPEPIAEKPVTLPGTAIPLSPLPFISIRRLSAAAAVLAILFTGVYLFSTRRYMPKNAFPVAAHTRKQTRTDVPPPSGANAILTLADGSAIQLDSTRDGTISRQGNASVSKSNNSKLVYKAVNNPSSAGIVYNTVSTRRGGQYEVVLPDRSRVWLNAGSSLRFPTSFTGKERLVELSGEAYFEIEKNSNMPFRVHVSSLVTGGMADIQVLGTSFNIMAYDNEKEIKTTLLDGAVKVSKGDKSASLSPGQQMKLNRTGAFDLEENADTELAIAWKNGFTSFKSADIKSIMRQVERWYDIEVVYEGDLPERTFSGGISRNSNLSELLRLLEVSKIHFRIEGGKLTVMP